jgi:hypothetical protein
LETKQNDNMKFTAKSLKTLSVIFLGLSLFGIGYTVVYEWGSDNKTLYSGLTITLALISVFLGIAAKRKKSEESKG